MPEQNGVFMCEEGLETVVVVGGGEEGSHPGVGRIRVPVDHSWRV